MLYADQILLMGTKVAETTDKPLPLADWISLIAPIALLAAYGLLTVGKLTADDYSYQWMNAIGAAALVYTVISPRDWGVLITEALWTLIGLYGVYKIWAKNKKSGENSKPRVK